MAEHPLEWDLATRQLLRALRGSRSQVAFNRRLGYRSNVAAAWEGGHRAPNAAELFRVCAVAGVDARAAVAAFHPPVADVFDPAAPAAWLSALRGPSTHAQLAERMHASRHQVLRWLSGAAVPRVPELLALVDALTGRAPDLVAALVDISQVPALEERYRAAQRTRRLATDAPWTAAVRILLETTAAAALPAHDPVWMARQLGIDPSEVERCTALLLEAGLAIREGERVVPAERMTVDVRSAGDRTRLRAHWAHVAADRIARGAEDLFSFSLVSVSRADLDRIRELQRRTFRELRSLVASSEPEVAALVLMQVVEWSEGPPPEGSSG